MLLSRCIALVFTAVGLHCIRTMLVHVITVRYMSAMPCGAEHDFVVLATTVFHVQLTLYCFYPYFSYT